MAYNVTDATLKQTTRCHSKWACVHGDNWDTCSIDSAIPEDGLIIKDKCKKSYCPYFNKFGYSYFFCYCPARREIFERYSK